MISFLKVVIMMSTGQVTYTQGISLCTSVLSLSWGAARAFMIMRTRDEADPNPEISTLVLRVWPYMIATTIANLALLVCMGGIFGGYIFCCLILNFLSVFTTLTLTAKHFRKKERGADGDEEEAGAEVDLSPRKGDTDPKVDKDVESLNQANGQADDKTSRIIASLCAVWIPCVVGRSSSKIFLISAITSLATKVVILAVAICLYETNLQHHLHKRPFLLLCRPENSPLLDAAKVTKCSLNPANTSKHLYCFSEGVEEAKNLIKMDNSLTKMLHAHNVYTKELNKLKAVGTKHILLRSLDPDKLNELKAKVTGVTIEKDIIPNIKILAKEVQEEMEEYGVGITQQKIRVCGSASKENLIRVVFLSVLIVAVLLAALSTVRLHQITDYKELFKR